MNAPSRADGGRNPRERFANLASVHFWEAVWPKVHGVDTITETAPKTTVSTKNVNGFLTPLVARLHKPTSVFSSNSQAPKTPDRDRCLYFQTVPERTKTRDDVVRFVQPMD